MTIFFSELCLTQKLHLYPTVLRSELVAKECTIGVSTNEIFINSSVDFCVQKLYASGTFINMYRATPVGYHQKIFTHLIYPPCTA